MNLVLLLRKFLRLEIMAAELYRVHVEHVPVWMQPLIHHFQIVEERHVARFQKLFQETTGQSAPSFKTWQKCIHFIGKTISKLGPATVLKVECWVEERAVRDYKQALHWVKDDAVKQAITQVLKDEDFHDRLMDTLVLFQNDERKHIHDMKKILAKLNKKKNANHK